MQRFYVQNSCFPVGCILPPHLGQVCKSHFLILSEPHLRQSLPTMELKLGAASPMTPPTTSGTILLQSVHDMFTICCPMNPRPSYTSVSYPHFWHLYIFFCDIGYSSSFYFNTQLASEYLPISSASLTASSWRTTLFLLLTSRLLPSLPWLLNS